MENRVSTAVHLESRSRDRRPFLRFLESLSSDQDLDVRILKGRMSAADSWLLVEISGASGEIHRALDVGRKWVGTAPDFGAP